MGLAWIGSRAPSVAPELFGASGAIAGWALLGSGALGVGPVGLRAHRWGLVLLGAALLVLPAVRPRAELLVSAFFGAAVLLRIGLVRWDGLEGEPDREVLGPAAAPPAEPAVPQRAAGEATAPDAVARASARVAGRLGGRAGTFLGREAAAALPRAARAAGRVAGRARQQPPSP